MDKGIGFKRNIYLEWLEEVARLRMLTDDPEEIRDELDPFIGTRIKSDDNRRMAIDILTHIWVKTADTHPRLHAGALALVTRVSSVQERLWLHYGLVLLAYPFFRDVAAIVGQMARLGELIRPADVKQRMIASRGSLGSLSKAVERVVSSMRDWDVLDESGERYAYAPLHSKLQAPLVDLELWLLACALSASEAEEMPFPDLVRLSELFPFDFTLGLAAVRSSAMFEVYRSGGGWDSVRLSSRPE